MRGTDMSNQEKPEINYPCHWSYRVIGSDKVVLTTLLEDIMGNREYTLAESNKSSSGKYVSLNLSTVVASEQQRESLFEQIKSNEAVKMVL